MTIIDTHCHLNFPDYNEDRDAVIARAAGAGVCAFVVVATGPDEWLRTLDLAEGRLPIRVALGIHPHEASVYSEKVSIDLRKLIDERKSVVAVGETGLDFFRNRAPRDKQFAAFKAQLHIAAELKKPFILHCRSAEPEMLEVLEEHHARSGAPLRGVWHCFTSTAEYAERAAKLGLYFGLGGVVTYPKSEELRVAVKTLPADRIVLETDCPFLPPQGWRGQRNEPSYLTKVVETLAQVRETNSEQICAATTANARALFGAW